MNPLKKPDHSRSIPFTFNPQQVVLEHVLQAMPAPSTPGHLTLLEMLACKLQTSTSPSPHLDLAVDGRWLLSLCCGELPVLMPWEFQRLGRFLEVSPKTLKDLVYHAGCAPGLGVLLEEHAPWLPESH